MSKPDWALAIKPMALELQDAPDDEKRVILDMAQDHGAPDSIIKENAETVIAFCLQNKTPGDFAEFKRIDNQRRVREVIRGMGFRIQYQDIRKRKGKPNGRRYVIGYIRGGGNWEGVSALEAAIHSARQHAVKLLEQFGKLQVPAEVHTVGYQIIVMCD